MKFSKIYQNLIFIDKLLQKSYISIKKAFN
ncbi:MAG: hypothetical protein JWR09_4575 [Mucilaginibacter sp.]|nr:hypothetical protein [Mucilaginibacter sp.]